MIESKLCEIKPGTKMQLRTGEEVVATEKAYLYPDGDDSEILLPCSDGKHHGAYDFV